MQVEKYRKREKNRVTDGTLQSRLSAIKKFEEFNGGGEPTVDDVENWVDELTEEYERGEIKSSTIRQYVKAVKYYFQIVLNQYENFEHVMRLIPEKDVDHGEYLTEEEWDTLRHNIHNYRNRAIVEIMYKYARRPGEIILLNKSDVDFEEGIITFNILKKEKDDRGNLLPMMKLKSDGEVYQENRVFRATFELEEEAEKFLRRYIKYRPGATETMIYDGEESEVEPLFTTGHGRISYSTVWRMVKEEARKAGIEKNITPKSQRHSRATHLNWSGYTPDEIADQQLVHGPETDVIGAYVHPRDEDHVREVMNTDGE